jgi:hypothetical protein
MALDEALAYICRLMAFTVNKGWTESDEGFAVRYDGRLAVRYREGERSMRVPGEWLATDGFWLDEESIGAWDPPHQHEPVLRDRLVMRVRDALAFRGIEV